MNLYVISDSFISLENCENEMHVQPLQQNKGVRVGLMGVCVGSHRDVRVFDVLELQVQDKHDLSCEEVNRVQTSDMIVTTCEKGWGLGLGITEKVQVNGVLRKVKEVNVRSADNLKWKKCRGRLRKACATSHKAFVDQSLTDSNVQHSQQVLHREIEATTNLGKLIGVTSIGREEDIIKDISRIIFEGSWGL
ncbi:hypothetical protein V6N13_049067 [Hibiscus sabdariffa]